MWASSYINITCIKVFANVCKYDRIFHHCWNIACNAYCPATRHHLNNDEFQPMQNCNILQLWHQFSVTNIFPFLHISLNLVAVHSIILLQCTTCNQLYSYKFASLWQGLNINHSTWLLCRLLYILYQPKLDIYWFIVLFSFHSLMECITWTI